MEPIGSEDDFRRRFLTSYEHEVVFGEIDMLRHVNNVRYAEWAETMRSRYFDDVLQLRYLEGTGVIIARHEMHYDAQVAYRDRLLIGGTVARWGTKSFDFETAIWSLTDARVAFHSNATLVAYDYSAKRSVVIPAPWRERAAALTRSGGGADTSP